MKFGSQLNTTLYPEWRFYYIDYDGLKRMIKTKGEESNFNEDEEAKFVEFLDKELEKVSAFQSIKSGEINRRIQHCESLVEAISMSNDTSVASYQKAEDEINRVIPEVNELAKFTRLNYTGFLKIIKKHDKHTGYALKPMFMVRINSKPFFKENFDALLLKLSRLYAIVRNDRDAQAEGTTHPHHSQHRVCRTVKYWVHPDNVMELKLYVLKYLPVLVYNTKANTQGKVDPRVSSVYLENDKFEIYTNRIEKKENSPTYCLSWFGGEDSNEIYVERKVHREDWMGETHTKQQFKIKEKYVDEYLAGEPIMKKVLGKLRTNETLPSSEIDQLDNLSEEIQLAIVNLKLKPTLRTFYNRTAFQMPGESTVRITLDTEVSMIREDNFDALRSGQHWRRRDVGSKYPFTNLPNTDITRFPFAVLEVKLETLAGSQTPKWVDHLINSHLVETVPNFSKYIHGVASLVENRVTLLPFWLPQMDKDIRRTPSPTFKFQQLQSSREASTFPSTNGSASTASTASRDNENVYIDFPPQSSNHRKSRSNSKSNKQNDERAPLLGSSNGADYGSRTKSGLFQSLFGSATNVPSDTSKVQRPTRTANNKRIAIPVRVEPKVFFANERTFLSWLNFALVLGGLALGLLNFGDRVGQISGVLFTVIAVLVMVYALLVFQWRADKIRNREAGPYDDRKGPIALVIVIFAAVMVNFYLKFSSLSL